MPTDGLRPGMRLGKSIYTADGRVLLQRNSELRENYIVILQRLKIPSVYIVNELAPDVEPMDVVSEPSRHALTAAMREALSEVAKATAQASKLGAKALPPNLNKHKLKAAVDMVVSDLLSNRSATVNLVEMRVEDDYTAAHCANVCALAVLLGLTQGLTVPQLHDLGVGAVLHDLGKAALSPEVLNRTEAGTPEELALVRQHTTLAWDILSKQSDMSFLSAAVALQHHERFSGGGYPRNLHGGDIHLYARVTAIADMYDMLVSDRGAQTGYVPGRALQKMTEYAGTYLDPDLLRVFGDIIAPFPVGTMVQVAGGLKAVVVAVERGRGARPRVRVVRDASGAVLSQPVEIDLAARSDLELRRLQPEEVFGFNPERMT